MAEPEKTENAAKAANTPATDNLPHVESPSISPADDKPEAPAEAPAPVTSLTIFTSQEKSEAPKQAPRFSIPPFALTRRMKRRAAMAASVALAACLGAVLGAATNHAFSKPDAKIDTVALEENNAMRKSIAHLSKELSALKTGVEATAKSTTTQIAKIADRVEKLDKPETTGSITKQAAMASTPLPPARPQTSELKVIPGWTAYSLRDGAIIVEGRSGAFEVSPGVALPGLGQVESVKREGDRWVVATPKGIILSSNMPPSRPRTYYPPYFRPF